MKTKAEQWLYWMWTRFYMETLSTRFRHYQWSQTTDNWQCFPVSNLWLNYFQISIVYFKHLKPRMIGSAKGRIVHWRKWKVKLRLIRTGGGLHFITDSYAAGLLNWWLWKAPNCLNTCCTRWKNGLRVSGLVRYNWVVLPVWSSRNLQFLCWIWLFTRRKAL